VTLPITVGFAGDGSGVVPREISEDILLGAANAFRGAIIGDGRRHLQEVVGDDVVRLFPDECLELTSRLIEASCLVSDPLDCSVLTESDAKLITTGDCAVVTLEDIAVIQEEALAIATDIGTGATPIVVRSPNNPTLETIAVAEPVTIPTESPFCETDSFTGKVCLK